MRSRDPEEMEEPTLRGSKELYFIILSHLETPAQRKPCGYKEGKCNRCNRMQQRLHYFACFNERCLLSRLSFPFEFHSLFPFRLPSLRSFSLPANGEQRSAAELHLRFRRWGRGYDSATAGADPLPLLCCVVVCARNTPLPHRHRILHQCTHALLLHAVRHCVDGRLDPLAACCTRVGMGGYRGR